MTHQDWQPDPMSRPRAAAARAAQARASAFVPPPPAKRGRPRSALDYRLRPDRGEHGTYYFHHADGKWRSLEIRGDEPREVLMAAVRLAREADERKAAGERNPLQIPLEEIFYEYVIASRPHEEVGRPHRFTDYRTIMRDLQLVLKFLGPNATLGDVSGKTCKAYRDQRVGQIGRHGKPISRVTAAQEIRKVGAAINHYCGVHGLNARAVTGRLPRSNAREDYLTEEEFARALTSARRGWIWDPKGDGFRNREYTGADREAKRHLVWVTGRGGWLRESYVDPESGATRFRNVVDKGFLRQGPSAASKGLNLQRALAIGYYTGSRNGVIRNLGWVPDNLLGWIDVREGSMHRSGLLSMPTETPGGKPLMSNKEGPSVLLPAPLLSLAASWRNADLRKEARHVVKAIGDEEPVGDTDPLASNGALQYQFAKTAARIGRKGVTIHTFRHTTLTQLALRGCSIDDAALFVGVAVGTVRRHYRHLGIHGTAVGAEFMARRDSKAKVKETPSPAEAFARQRKALAAANQELLLA